MKPTSFDETAKAATKAGSAAKQEVAEMLAADFVSGAGFDPRRLADLGPHGLRIFLDSVASRGLQAPPHERPQDHQKLDAQRARDERHQWAEQRCPEPIWLLQAVAVGTTFGLATALFGAALMWHLNIL